MEIEVTEFEMFLLREGHRTMKEQIIISKARKKQAVEQEAGKKEAEKEKVEEEVEEKESEVKETEVKKTEEVKEVEETEVKKDEETKDEAAEEEKMAAEKEVAEKEAAEKEAAEKEVAEKPGESVAAAAVPDLCEDVVALLAEAKAAILARRARRAIVTLHQDQAAEKEAKMKEAAEKELAEKELAEKEAAEKKPAEKKAAEKVADEPVAVLDMCEVVAALLVEAEAAVLATVGARRAIVAIHQDLNSLTSLPTLPRHVLAEVEGLSEVEEVLSEVQVPSEVMVPSEVEVLDEGEVLGEVEELELDNLNKDAFGKVEEHSWLSSKLASEQEFLESIVPHYTATSRSAGKSSNVTPDLEVVDELGHCKDVVCEDAICKVQKIADKQGLELLADKQVLELLADKLVLELLVDKKVFELLADKKVLGSNVLAFALGTTFKPFDRGKQKRNETRKMKNERRKKKKVV